MKHKIFSLCALLVFIISCKKDEPVIMVNDDKTLLSQVIINNQPSIEYSYNSLKLVEEEKSNFDLVVNHYNDKNLLSSSDYYVNFDILNSDQKISGPAINLTTFVSSSASNKSGTIKYDYNSSDQMIKAAYSPVSGGTQSSSFSYDANGNITKQTIYWETTVTGYIGYTYDQDGNLTEEDLYSVSSSGSEELVTTTAYEYDKQQNPFNSASRMKTPGVGSNKNNITKETYTIHALAGKGNDKVQVTVSSYKYNAKGFPVSKSGNVEYVYI